MPLFSAARLVVLAAALLAVLGAFAGVSSGSSTQPLRATAPKLIAHDTSAFFPVLPRSGPERLTARHIPVTAKKKAERTGRTLYGAGTSVLHDFPAPTAIIGAPPSGLFTTGDIGRTQYLEAVDGNYAIYSRVGGFLASVPNKAFWSGIGGSDAAGLCATNPTGEPAIAYDRGADRWIVAEAGYSGGTWVECFALSTSGNAAGTWNRYVFSISSSVHPAMPSIGVWPDGYYLSFNQEKGANWDGAGALVVDRQAMLAHPGSEPTARYFDLSKVTPGLGGMRVATQESPNGPSSGAPALYAQLYDDPLNTNDRLELWSFHVDWSAPASGSTFTRTTSLSVPAFTTGVNDVAFTDSAASPPLNYVLPQLGAQLEYYNNGSGTQTLTLTDTIQATDNIGWYQLANSGSGWGVSDKGPYAATSDDSAPVAAFDGGSVALGYISTVSGVVKLTAGDATNSLIAPSVIGSGASTRSKALTLDPLQNCTFWLSGPNVAEFSFAGCATSSSAAPVLTADPTWTPGLVQEGTATVAASAGSFSGATTTVDQWLLCDLNGLNCVDIPGANATTYIPLASQADGLHTLRFSETASNSVGSSTAISAPAAVIESLPPVNTTAPAISGTAETGATLSVDNGTWTSSSSPQFTYRWQRCTGATCSNIDGATSSTYVPTTADVGSTLDVVVTATNTGGGADIASAQTAAVVVAPPGSTDSGTTTTTTTTTTSTTTTSSGSGSTVKNPPDLKLGVTASAASAPVGQNVTLYYTVSDKNNQPARSLKVTLTLPSGLAYAGNYAERGPGCVANNATTVVCSLDYVSALTPVTRVQVYVTVKDSSAQTVSATASSSDGEVAASDNTASIAVGTGSESTSTAVGSTAPPPILGPDGMPVGLNGTAGKSAAGIDMRAPKVSALASSGKRGSSAALKFRISDDSGVASAAATIERNGQKVGSVSTGFGPVAAGSVYFVAWHVPAKAAKGTYSFCVVASDRSRHSSKQSCAPLAVR